MEVHPVHHHRRHGHPDGRPRSGGVARLTSRALMPSTRPTALTLTQWLSQRERERGEIMSLASNAGVVVLRLLGGKRAMPDTFDAAGPPLPRRGHTPHRLPRPPGMGRRPGHRLHRPLRWRWMPVFSYLMQGGVQNFQNLFLFLSDTYFGTGHGHEAPAPLPWEGIYHPDTADGDGRRHLHRPEVPAGTGPASASCSTAPTG